MASVWIRRPSSKHGVKCNTSAYRYTIYHWFMLCLFVCGCIRPFKFIDSLLWRCARLLRHGSGVLEMSKSYEAWLLHPGNGQGVPSMLCFLVQFGIYRKVSSFVMEIFSRWLDFCTLFLLFKIILLQQKLWSILNLISINVISSNIHGITHFLREESLRIGEEFGLDERASSRTATWYDA